MVVPDVTEPLMQLLTFLQVRVIERQEKNLQLGYIGNVADFITNKTNLIIFIKLEIYKQDDT